MMNKNETSITAAGCIQRQSLDRPPGSRLSWRILIWLVALLFPGHAFAQTATIEATDAVASADGSDSGAFTITLNEPVSVDVDINISYGGTAQEGVDYEPCDVCRTIPAGSTSTTIEVKPVATGSEEDKTVVATLEPGDYEIGTPSSAVVTIFGVPPTPSTVDLAIESGNNQVVSGRQSLQPFVVKTTSNGVATAGITIAWTLETGQGALSSNTSVTDSNGLASSTLTPGADGEFVIRAQIEGTDQSVVFSATVTNNNEPPLNLSIAGGNNQVALSGQPLEPFVVRATSNGAGVSGVPIIWSLQQGQGSITSERRLTDAQGLASTTLTPTSNGTYVVSAQIEGTDLSVVFSASLDPLSSLSGLTPNQRVIARTVETLCPRLGAISGQRTLTSGEQDLLSQCNALISSAASNPSAAVQGVVALTPEQASAPRKMTSRITGAQLDNIATRLTALRHGAHGVSLGNLTMSLGGQSINGNALASLSRQLGATGGAASADDGFEFERLGIFVNGNIDWGDKDGTSNEDGFDFKTLGITAGVDYRFLEGLVLGLALGYGNSDVDIDADGGDLGANAWTAMLYGTYYATDHFYLEGSASYGWGSYDQTRNIAYSLLGGTREAKADFDGNQYAFMLGAGYDFIRGEGILDVYGRLQYVRADIDAYRESGASGLDLKIGSQSDTSFKSILGVNFTRSISTAKAILIPQGWLEWAHEFDDGDDEVTGVFANDPSRISFALATDKFDSDYFRLGLGLGAQFGQGRTAFVSYEAAIGLNDYTEHTASVGVRLEF